MPLQYVESPRFQYQPLDIGMIDTVLGRRQQRYDTSVAQREAALQEALSRGFIDENAREDYLARAKDKFAQVSQKYRGDLSKGRDELLSAVTDVRTDPYIQANQAQLDAYKQQQSALTQLGQYGYVDPKYDVSQQSLLDDEGKYRTTFQPKVTDIREFDKIGAMAGTAYAKSNMRDERNLAGYIDRVQGFKTPEEASSFVEQNPDYITGLMQQQGLDPNNDMFRRRVEQGFINSSVGGVKQVADRNFASQLELEREARAKELHKANLAKLTAQTNTYKDKGKKDKTTSSKGLPMPHQQVKIVDTFNKTLNNANDELNLLQKSIESTKSFKDRKTPLGAELAKTKTGETVKRYIDFITKHEKDFDIELPEEVSTNLAFIAELNQAKDKDNIELREQMYKSLFDIDMPTKIIKSISDGEDIVIADSNVDKQLDAKINEEITNINNEMLPFVEQDLPDLIAGFKALNEINSDTASIPTVKISNDVLNRQNIQGKDGYINPFDLSMTYTDSKDKKQTLEYEEYMEKLNELQRTDAEATKYAIVAAYSGTKLQDTVPFGDKGAFIKIDAANPVKDKGTSRKRADMIIYNPVIDENGNVISYEPERTTPSLLLNILANNVAAAASDELTIGKTKIEE